MAKKVKWALGGAEPEDLQEFLSNEDIVDKNKGLPPKGVYTFLVRQISVGEIKNGDNAGKQRLRPMLVMDEPKKSKAAAWNGYVIWDGLNVTDQGAPFLKRFLKGLGVTWSDFIDRSQVDDDDKVVQIGKVKFNDKPPHVRVMVRAKPADQYNDIDYLDVARYLPKETSDDSADEAAVEAVDMSADEEKPAKKSKGKKAKAEPEDEMTIAFLDKQDTAYLSERATKNGMKPKKVAKATDEELREFIRQSENLPPF